jgi:hypothetical protein
MSLLEKLGTFDAVTRRLLACEDKLSDPHNKHGKLHHDWTNRVLVELWKLHGWQSFKLGLRVLDACTHHQGLCLTWAKSAAFAPIIASTSVSKSPRITAGYQLRQVEDPTLSTPGES